eukprot:s1500_g18.t1
MDTDAIVVGQESNLVWTEKGLQSDLAKKYESMDPKPEVGKPVKMLILMHQKNLRKEGLRNGWFEEVQLDDQAESRDPSQKSLLQKAKGGLGSLFEGMKTADGSCEPPPAMKKCTSTFKSWYFQKCTQEIGWQYSSMQADRLKCDFSAEKPAKTPLECKEMFAKEVKFARYFEFDTATQKITCKKVKECRKSLDGILQDFGDDAKAEGMNFQMIGFWHLGD